DYFIRIRGSYQSVKSKAELLTLLHDHQKELQKYIKKSKLDFRRSRENLLVMTTEYYDQIAK
ncbi:MAG TPA: hypothetical protein VFI33_15260, partial [Puia sp.]|nr:hypothetical protein [Puia sp.]